MRNIIIIALLFVFMTSCGPEVKEHERTVKSLKTGKIYQHIIHDMQKKGDVILISDPVATLIDRKEGVVYDSVQVMDDAPKKD